MLSCTRQCPQQPLNTVTFSKCDITRLTTLLMLPSSKPCRWSRQVVSFCPSPEEAMYMRPVSDAPSEEVLDRDTFLTEFKTEAYLQDFYAKVEDPAMQMVLTCLPNIVARIGEVKRVLDFGAGPTIHVAASFRNQAAE
ncbi:hypothetical protein TELCIR_10562, partial [Teladorsagia circumcincta]